MISHWMFSLLALGAPPAAPSAAFPQDPAPQETPAEEPKAQASAYDALLSEYQAAVKDFRARVRQAEGAQAKAALRKHHPAKDFLGRFEALVQQGDGRGLLWKAATQRERNVPRKEREAERLDAYTQVLKEFPRAAWLEEAMATVARDKQVDLDHRVRLFQHVANGLEHTDEHRLLARFHAGGLLFAAKDETKQKLGKELLQALIQEDPKSAIALRAKAIIEKPDLSVGSIAPEFVGQTIDGETLRLSDYRGKVVLLDFFGFW